MFHPDEWNSSVQWLHSTTHTHNSFTATLNRRTSTCFIAFLIEMCSNCNKFTDIKVVDSNWLSSSHVQMHSPRRLGEDYVPIVRINPCLYIYSIIYYKSSGCIWGKSQAQTSQDFCMRCRHQLALIVYVACATCDVRPHFTLNELFLSALRFAWRNCIFPLLAKY